MAEAAKEKTVKIRIPRTKADQEDVPVWVNDRSWIIKRGVDVEVPECVAEVRRHQEEALRRRKSEMRRDLSDGYRGRVM